MGFMLNILYLVILLNIVNDKLSNSIMLIICQICILILYTCLLIIHLFVTRVFILSLLEWQLSILVESLFICHHLYEKIKMIEYITINDPLIL